MRNWPDLGYRFVKEGTQARSRSATSPDTPAGPGHPVTVPTGHSRSSVTSQQLEHAQIDGESGVNADNVCEDVKDLSWATVLKRTFEAYVRQERPNMVSFGSLTC